MNSTYSRSSSFVVDVCSGRLSSDNQGETVATTKMRLPEAAVI